MSPGSLIFFDSIELSAVDPLIIIDHMFAVGCIWMFFLQKEDGVCIKSCLVTCQIKYFESIIFPKVMTFCIQIVIVWNH